jgi:hypothetical protein
MGKHRAEILGGFCVGRLPHFVEKVCGKKKSDFPAVDNVAREPKEIARVELGRLFPASPLPQPTPTAATPRRSSAADCGADESRELRAETRGERAQPVGACYELFLSYLGWSVLWTVASAPPGRCHSAIQ